MLVKSVLGLADLIEREKIPPLVVQPTDLPAIDKQVCWFCLTEKYLPVRVNSHAASEGRLITIKEKKDGKLIDVVYGICSPCAEKRGLVLRLPEAE